MLIEFLAVIILAIFVVMIHYEALRLTSSFLPLLTIPQPNYRCDCRCPGCPFC
jgi:hypothetical protein